MNLPDLRLTLNSYSSALDGLRAIAVIAVIINHFNHALLPSGYLGVDIFFVLSGFVITASILKRKETNAGVFFLGFYKRRIKRLLPALLLCFSITAVLISFFCRQPNEYITTGLFSIPGFSNIKLYFNAVDYWGQSARLNPFTHTWSLGVEEQFYFVFPLMIWLFVGRHWREKSILRLRVILLFFLLASLGIFIYFSESAPMSVYFLSPFRFWEIGAGCLIYLTLRNYAGPMYSTMVKVPVNLLIALLFASLFIPLEYSIFATITVVFLTSVLIVKIKSEEHFHPERKVNFLVNNFSLYIGKTSYSLYLWHWVFIALARWTIGLTFWSIPILIVLIFSFSSFSYHFVEKPLRHSSWRKSIKPKLILAPLLLVLFFFIISFSLPSNSNILYLGQTKRTSLDNSKMQSSRFVYDKSRSLASNIQVIGNSHSIHITPMLQEITSQLGTNLIYENHPNYVLIPSGNMEEIDKLNEVLTKMEPGDLLILSSRFRYLYEIPYLTAQGDRWIDHSDEKRENGYGLELWLQELDIVINKGKSRGINILLFMPNIEFDVPVLNPREICDDQWFRIAQPSCNPRASKSFLERRFSSEFYSEVDKRKTTNANFYIFDPLPIYCPSGDSCALIVEGVAAFSDTNHLSEEGAMLMAEPFFNFLEKNQLIYKEVLEE